ncbi:HEAT repeat domain-containing protein [Nocardioides alcanivorans]|uniref:HEAT repeat domain-containing protein n=1 Tax=Nocardioides alcanivorans TaxID=2897352 RepID=UPI001F21BC1A|nr:HEAT repeat domain-containing protein [Nocardioides alcanivorans]
MGFLTPGQRAALAASTAAGPPLSSFASPPASEGKVRRVHALAASPKAVIRESAALAHHAPREVLEVLADDAEVGVRRCVARNEHTPAPVLRKLSRDPDPLVRGWVAANPTVPDDLLVTLATDPDPGVRAVVTWAEGWRC